MLYKHRRNSDPSFLYSTSRVESFVRGTGSAKLTRRLENSSIISATCLFACLALGAAIIGLAYYLDKNLVTKISRLN